MKNKKGFVMTETLVVTVFLVTIFTFIYVSIVPLIGQYEDKIKREGDIDIVYKLYNIRKMMKHDVNRYTMTSGSNKRITCTDFSNSAYCNKMMQFMELSNYVLLYVDNINNNLNYINGVNSEMYEYISKFKDSSGKMLILLDLSIDLQTNNPKHNIVHLLYEN